ncbi:ThiF family adenylyltransferase [Thiorhodovibrio frisius]|uniref:ThiF family adenylyltransferase n=1 Tax=Thiorhodovibrio frisius TaxID=631362 RepID=UPI00167F521B|nr:ThiF family adenylyltransferase [Thiorhodovibrio frisius]
MLEQLILLDTEDYERASDASLVLTDKASSRLNRWAVQLGDKGWLAVHLHSHPSGIDHFSATDDAAESALSQWLDSQGVAHYWSLVWPSRGIPRARLWMCGKPFDGQLYLGLAPMDTTTSTASPALDRQRAFGPGLRQAAKQIRVGLVGVGGLGMLALEQLARAGFRRFVLVDPDTIEVSNLNRLPSVTARDIGRFKVQVGKRLVQQIARSLDDEAEVSAWKQDIYRSRAAQRALGSCDLILAVTDNELSRTMALSLALDSGREYLQAGSDITLGEDGSIIGLRAEVTGAETGRYCPICSGRLSPGQASIEARAYASGEVVAHARSEGYLPDVAAPAVMSLNSVAAGMLVMEIQRRASGLGVRDLVQMDLQSSRMLVQDRVQVGHDCEICGALASPPTTSPKAPTLRPSLGVTKISDHP